MRETYEILELLLERLSNKKTPEIEAGMCYELVRMNKYGEITNGEYFWAKKLILDYRMIHEIYYENDSDYMFEPGLIGPRIEVLKKIIEEEKQ